MGRVWTRLEREGFVGSERGKIIIANPVHYLVKHCFRVKKAKGMKIGDFPA
jgi:DNA-binding transcriptional regulator YhcF (GntR family)